MSVSIYVSALAFLHSAVSTVFRRSVSMFVSVNVSVNVSVYVYVSVSVCLCIL